MNEQAPVTPAQKNEEYLADYPNAIVDSAKAEEVAYAVKALEEEVITNSNNAAETVRQIIDEERLDGTRPRHLVSALNTHMQRAESARVRADEAMSLAGETYDRMAPIRSGKTPVHSSDT